MLTLEKKPSSNFFQKHLLFAVKLLLNRYKKQISSLHYYAIYASHEIYMSIFYRIFREDNIGFSDPRRN